MPYTSPLFIPQLLMAGFNLLIPSAKCSSSSTGLAIDLLCKYSSLRHPVDPDLLLQKKTEDSTINFLLGGLDRHFKS